MQSSPPEGSGAPRAGRSFMDWVRLLFGVSERVTRMQYLVIGLLLAPVKFGIDTAIVYGSTGKTWSPLGYVIPSQMLRMDASGAMPEWAHLLLAVTTLPFLWIGVSMSVRRAADAGISPWWGLWFLVPVLHYIAIAALAMFPPSKLTVWKWKQHDSTYRGPTPVGEAIPVSELNPAPIPSAIKPALLGAAAGLSAGMVGTALCVFALKGYGIALFVMTPFAMGAVSAVTYTRTQDAIAHRGGSAPKVQGAIGVGFIALLITSAALLLFAVEGVLCLAMAFPLASAVSMFGSVIGFNVARRERTMNPQGYAAFMLALPAAAGMDAMRTAPVRDVTTVIEVDAPPDRVWPNVVKFSELPPPSKLMFRLGIAYPKRARIEGDGVGAVRHCEFSTGAFVEPITVWDPPTKERPSGRLAFEVTAEPPSMHEWSPYELHAPHLRGGLSSKGGEFLLEPIDGGRRTRLSGTTHYTLAFQPQIYWTLPAELILHSIHRRVLDHVRGLSER